MIISGIVNFGRFVKGTATLHKIESYSIQSHFDNLK